MRTLLFLLAFVAVAVGCDSSGPDSGIGDLTVSLDPSEPGTRLVIGTVREYPTACGLDARVDATSESVEVEILGVGLEAQVCPAVVGPLLSSVRLPDTGIEGYEIEIVKDGETDRYRVGRDAPDLPLRLEAVGTGSFSRIVPYAFPED